MAQYKLKILKVMNEITSKVSLKEFLDMIGLTSNQAMEHMQGLVEAGFLVKVGRGYSITEKGKIAIKELSPVTEGTEFHFYTGIGKFTGLSAKSLKDFVEVVRKVDSEALEFHVSRRDFENWMKAAFDDRQLADEIGKVRESKQEGENLRNEIIRATETRYSQFERLLSS